jgi:NADPH:quinone reductase-like Zn-dependent oxidoreductase
MVVDNVGSTLMSNLRTLRKNGRLPPLAAVAGPSEIDNRYVFYRHVSIIGSTMSPLSDFKTVMDLVVLGRLKPVLDKIFELPDAAAAQRRMENGEHFGKIILRIG